MSNRYSGRKNFAGHLVGPKHDAAWAKWRESRNRAIAKPTRTKAALELARREKCD